jgi:aminoglycoside phosphotransferase (APT) family kinase protein
VDEGVCVTDVETSPAQRFESLLASVESGRGGKVTSYKPIPGGYSRETALADVQWNDGTTERFVLRADPAGGEGVFSSDRDREWRLLQALATIDSFIIPRPRWYDATGEHFGSKCIVMDFCKGTPLQLTLGDASRLNQDMDTYLEVAASLQRAPLDGLPADLERPNDWEQYLDRAIDVYERAERDLPDSSPIIRYVCAWLRAHRPPPVPLSLVHGDFQPGNILVAEGKPPVVIDWEFTHIGDPREDVGYYSGSPLPNSLYVADPDRFLVRYRELTGLTEDEVNPQVMDYFFLVGMAHLFAQMMDGAAVVAEGQGGGVMNLFLINSLSYFQDRYLDICRSA